MKKTLFALLLSATWPAAAQDAYIVGVSAAMTGPGAATYAPVVEAMKAYIDHVNLKGGVNGKPIRLLVQDDGAEPSKAAANAKKLLTQDKVLMLINTSLSSTYAPMIAEARQANVPLYFGGSVCPKETYPPADPMLFCSSAFGANLDSQGALAFVKAQAKDPVRIGFAAMAIPIARAEIDYAEGLSKTMGMTPVEKQISPPPTPDYTPFATRLKEANPNWVFSWSPWVSQVRTFEAMRRLGWSGRYVTWAHQGRRFLRHRHQRVLPGRSADPRRNPRGDAPRQPEISRDLPDRRLHRGNGDRVDAEEHALAADAAEGAGGDERTQGGHEGPAWRPSGVDQGQSLSHEAVLPRVEVGHGKGCGRPRAGLAGDRREAMTQTR